jgi:hypothetical protein
MGVEVLRIPIVVAIPQRAWGVYQQRALRPQLEHTASVLGHRERDAAVVLGEGVWMKMCVHLLRDRNTRVAEDLRQLEDVASGREEKARERVPKVVKAQLPVHAST